MRSHKIMSLGCCAFIFFAITQLVGCAKPASGSSYKANVKSKTLVIDKQVATIGENFSAKISLAEGIDDTYSIPTKLRAVSINGFDVDDKRYSYNPTTGDFAVMAPNLTGDVVVTAEADKITKTPGDYAHVYAPDSNHVTFTFNDLFAGKYFVSAVAHGQSLDCYYNVPGGIETKAVSPLIEIKSYGTYIFRFQTIDGKNINDYVTAAIVSVVNDSENDYARYRLKTEYNKKIVAFNYAPPVTSSNEDFRFRPLIADGAKCLGDIPEDLKALLPAPTIFNVQKNFAVTQMEKKGDSNCYYIGSSSDYISEQGNYFVAYLDKIDENNNVLEISTEVAGDESYQLTLLHDSTHQIFVFYNTSANGSYYVYNNIPTFYPSSVYAVSNFEQLQIYENSIFTVSNTLAVFVTYKLKLGERAELENYGIGEYNNEVENSTITIQQPREFRSKTIVFGAKPDAEGKENPIASMNLGVAEARNSRYSYIIATTSTETEIVRRSKVDDYFYGSGSELDNSGGKIKIFFIRFGWIARSITEDGKYINYYAPVPEGTINVNYYLASDDVQSVTLDKVYIPFNGDVSKYDSISFIPKHPIMVTTKEETPEDKSIIYASDRNSNLYLDNAFPGIPYTCEINPAAGYKTPETGNVTIDDESATPVTHEMIENVLHLTPKNDTKNITITATNGGDFQIELLHRCLYFQDRYSTFLIYLHKSSTVVLRAAEHFALIDPDKVKDPKTSDFDASCTTKEGYTKTIAATKFEYDTDKSPTRLTITYSDLNVEELLKDDLYKKTFCIDRNQRYLEKYVKRRLT